MASVREAMTLLDVSRPTVLKYLSDGKLSGAIKRDGLTGEWDIPREAIEAVRQERINALRREISKLERLAEYG